MQLYTAQFDGSSRTDDEKSTIGFIIYMPTGSVLCRSRRVVVFGDSMESEYRALIELLKTLNGFKVREVIIRGDCRSLIEQVKGNQPVKEHLQELCSEVLNLMCKFDHCTIEWIARRQNAKANGLSRKSLGVMKV